MISLRRLGSTQYKVAALVFCVTSLLVGALATYFPAYHLDSVRNGLERKAVGYGQIVGREVESAVAFDDQETAREAFESAATDPDVRALALFGAKGKLLFARGELSDTPPIITPRKATVRALGEVLRATTPVVSKEGPRGALVIELSTSALATERARVQRAALGLGAVALGLGLVAAWLIGRSLAQRLGAIAKRTAAVGGGDFAQPEIQDASHDEIGQLARGFNDMVARIRALVAHIATQAAEEKSRLDALVAARTKELDASNRDLHLVLDHVGEGFLTVDRLDQMSRERSLVLTTWLGAARASERFADYVGRFDPDFTEAWTLSLESLFEDVLPRELLLEQFPRSFKKDDRIYRVRVSAIEAKDGALDRVLVVIADATSDVARERAEASQRELVAVFDRILRDEAGFFDFYAEAGKLVRHLSNGEPDEATERRLLHTLKGNASLFGLGALASLCHAIEARLADEGAAMSHADRREVTEAWGRVAAIVSRLPGRAPDHIDVDKADLRRLRDAALSAASTQALLESIEALEREPVKRRFERFAEQARSLGARLGKPGIDVKVDSGGLRLDAPRWSRFWSAFAHGIRNAVDHGIEAPEVRAARGKGDAGRLTLRASQTGSDVVIELHDDGGGIRWDKVAERARSLGAPSATRADLELAIFQDGLSTGEEVTEVSGRGVGLGALRAACLDLGGRVEVQSKPGEGTTFRFRVPCDPPRRRTTKPPPFGMRWGQA
jgi:two-component system chemotaxis sensor kinase CheA